jgi:O-antigen ligase
MLLAGYLLFALLLGTTEAGRLTTEVRAVAALTGGIIVAAYIWLLPRRHDLVDVLTLAALLAFLLSCVTSSAPRASFDAATTAVAYAAAFYLARGLFAEEAHRRLAITLLGLIGVVVGVLYVSLWGVIWFRWAAIAGAPPLDLNLPPALYQHRYLVGMLTAMLFPATVILARRPGVWPIGLIGAVSTLAVTFMCGGRTVWLAGLATAAFWALPTASPIRRSTVWRRPSRIALVGMCAAALIVMAIPILSRLGATSTIELRLAMWLAALGHWLQSPVLGFGPGSFASEFATTGYQSTFNIDVPHAHNALVQALFEGGLAGAVGLALVCAAIIAGVFGSGGVARSLTAALAFFAFASFTDNPTTVPFLVVLAIIWAALAMPRMTTTERTPMTSVRVLTLTSAGIAAVAVFATLAGAWAFDRARDAAAEGDERGVVSHLKLASELDRSFPLYHRELGVWLAIVGRTDLAADELREAIRLNDGDDEAIRDLAVLSGREQDRVEALQLARRLETNKAYRVQDVLTAAYVRALVGDNVGSQQALVRAVQIAPWIIAAPEWKHAFPAVDVSQTLSNAEMAWAREPVSTRSLKARAWISAMVGTSPQEGAGPALDLQTAVIGCSFSRAESLVRGLAGSSATEVEALRGQVMLRNAAKAPPSRNEEALLLLRDPAMPAVLSSASDVLTTSSYDASIYSRRSLPRAPVLSLPTDAGGMSAWLRDPLASATRGAPGSPLARCQ